MLADYPLLDCRTDQATVRHLELIAAGCIHRQAAAALYRTGNDSFTRFCGRAHIGLSRLVASGDSDRARRLAALILRRWW